MEATPVPDLDRAVETLADNRKAWVDIDVPGRIALLERMLADTHAVAQEWATRSAAMKGIPLDSPQVGEEWLAGPSTTLRMLRLLKRTLEDVRDHGEPQIELRTRASGQVVAPVTPSDWMDRLLFAGYEAEIWLQPHVTLEQARGTMAARYRPGGKDAGGVCFVIGAGNISSIPATDALYKMFVEDRVVVLKMNPVNEALGPFLEAGLRAMVDGGFLRIVYGGADEGRHLTDHPRVDEIHMTGSDKTFEAIVFGTGEEGRRRLEQDEPRLDKPITAELGNVTPVIVVPGPWSDRDVAFQSENLASMLTHNAGFNCIAGRVIVTHRKWARRRDLLDGLRGVLASTPSRLPYYPGARDRWERFVDTYPQAETFGPLDDEAVPWTFIPDIPAHSGELALGTEVFCGVTTEVPLDAPTSVPQFIEQAVRFCNEDIWGTLGATIIVHPRSLRDPAVKEAVERAIEDLRYGAVLVNHWPGLVYGLMSTSWGAFPGHDRTDIQSGTGTVHNSFMVEEPQKTVLRGPFRPPLKPIWFPSHRTLDQVAEAATALEATSDPKIIPRLVWAAVRG